MLEVPSPLVFVKPRSLSTALNAYAKEYASQAHLPLLAAEAEQTGSSYAGTISSLGSNAVFEYSDAGGGITQGAFQIENARVMA